MDFTNIDKVKAYAIALPDDVSAERFEVVENERFEVVENKKLWRGYIGTVYGTRVSTERGHKFLTFEEARANAEFFVEQCKTIASQST